MTAPKELTKPAHSRRTLLGVAAAGSLGGGIWTVGLATLARGTHPQVFVVGEDSWQVALIEHGSARMVVLLGEFPEDPSPAIDRTLTTLRQHVDAIAGDRESLNRLDWTYRKWNQALRLDLGQDASDGQPNSRIAVEGRLDVAIGDWFIAVHQSQYSGWNRIDDTPYAWFARLSAGGNELVLANSLDVAYRQSTRSTVLLAAPGGDAISAMISSQVGLSIAVNASAIENIPPPPSFADGRMLIRTFPRDIASFQAIGDRLTLPDWATPF